MTNQNLLELIDEVEKEVIRLRYSDLSLKKYSKIWEKLKQYCNNKEINNYSVDVGNSFLKEIYNLPDSYYQQKGHHDAYRSIMILNSYMCYGEIYTKYFLKKRTFNDSYQNLMDQYLKYCKEERLNANKTINYKTYAIKRILSLLDKENVTDFNQIDITIIKKYLEMLSDVSQNSLKLYIYTLKDFFEFLFQIQKTKTNLKYLVPNVKISKYPILPSVWKNEDIKKLIESIDTHNPIGKRDYALILLVAKLGIRVMDLKHLKFNNIDWKKKEIHFVTSKTKTNQILPLPNDVGWAIIDYIKNGRPKCEAEEIFIRHVKPIGPFNDNDALAGIIKKYMRLGNIEIDKNTKKKGMHSLRHSLATNLLKNNIPIDSISSILSHNNKGSVSYYLKVDIDRLNECNGDDEFYEI